MAEEADIEVETKHPANLINTDDKKLSTAASPKSTALTPRGGGKADKGKRAVLNKKSTKTAKTLEKGKNTESQ